MPCRMQRFLWVKPYSLDLFTIQVFMLSFRLVLQYISCDFQNIISWCSTWGVIWTRCCCPKRLTKKLHFSLLYVLQQFHHPMSHAAAVHATMQAIHAQMPPAHLMADGPDMNSPVGSAGQLMLHSTKQNKGMWDEIRQVSFWSESCTCYLKVRQENTSSNLSSLKKTKVKKFLTRY